MKTFAVCVLVLAIIAGPFILATSSSDAAASAGLVNMSVRAPVLADSQLIYGLVVDSPCRLLIRAAGPALTGFGVTAALSNPKLSLVVGERVIVTNDDWASTISNHDAVRDAAAKAGAFPFTFGSKDAGIVVGLSAGTYSCLVTGDPGTSGEVLLEIYRVPR